LIDYFFGGKVMRRQYFYFLATMLLVMFPFFGKASEFTEHFPNGISRIWVGEDYWANRLQDWRIDSGRLECVTSQENRNIFLLTCGLTKKRGSFHLSFKTGLLTQKLAWQNEGWIGVKFGVRGRFNDYRDDAVYGDGMCVGITAAGKLFLGAPPVKIDINAFAAVPRLQKSLELSYDIEYKNDQYSLILHAIDPQSGKVIGELREDDVPSQYLHGGISLVSSFRGESPNNETPSCWFDDISISGAKVKLYPERAFGPILFSQYTLSKKILKMSVQMPPVGKQDGTDVAFQVKKGGVWTTIAAASIDSDARNALFKIKEWNDSENIPYRLVYKLAVGDGKSKEYYFEGRVRKNPVDKEDFTLAAFTGNFDIGFPNNDIVKGIKKIDPDMLFFSGDQIYEPVAGYGTQNSPVNKAILDYLRKWYIYGWAYRDILKDRPTISIPDDHDVFHGNLWGCAGKHSPVEKLGYGMHAQDAGGYKMPTRWVKMVERTQTSNLPDPFDPTPVKQGIGVYYTSLNYGEISFAIIEDRKFKSAPKPILPEAKIVNGFFQNSNWNPITQGDVPEAQLLGERQLNFLDKWVEDWSYGAKMKVLLSATVFETVATLPESAKSDAVVPSLRILQQGEYPPDDKQVADMDSNGWPQTGRNNAVRTIRKGYAFHIAGDQHLATFTKYGLDNWRDSSYAFCVPSIANVWPRRWCPKEYGQNRQKGAPHYTGDFKDAFGNKLTVYAAANPFYTGRKPSNLYDRSTGYGVIDFNKKTRSITSHCWPRYADPTAGDSGEYKGWPITVNQYDNFSAPVFGWLPTVHSNIENPVVKVYKDGEKKELIYGLRIKGRTFNSPVFEDGKYLLEVSDPDNDKIKIFKSLTPSDAEGSKIIEVKF
jgi:hypothetical protein